MATLINAVKRGQGVLQEVHKIKDLLMKHALGSSKILCENTSD